MTTTPNFDDLTPPDELMRELAAKARSWSEATTWEALRDAYRACARHGWEQARQLWPEPITDRPPTEADGDAAGRVQVLIDTGGPLPSYWSVCDWSMVGDRPWLHTASWQPRQPSPVTPAEGLAALAEIRGKYPGYECEFLDKIQSALEQAGEGQT